MWVTTESRQSARLHKAQSFFATKVVIPQDVADRIYELQDKIKEAEKYLGAVASGTQPETLTWLDEKATLVVVKESPRKRKASARTSKGKSPQKSSPAEEPTTTSQKTPK